MLQLDPQLTKQENFTAGQVILIDKPLTWTSFDVVKKIRNLIRIKKVGHAGTLDPLATGLLILCTGKKTKSIEGFMGQEKEYTGTFTIGQTTPTYDLESEVTAPVPIDHIGETELENARKQFIGDIEQVPPMHSAIKVNGKRLYEHARKGEKIEVKTRNVSIKEFELTEIDLPVIKFRVVCSKGTYIRSLAHDFGAALGVGAHLSSLRRTKIGDFKVDNAYKLDDLVSLLKDIS
ncbi:tRNA pseudouridine(55) synthase TruB [Roseivirga misakiensis]|uniref:tRNA pseudouridine synthase B n=1 Tax=Roseivirga misakiensis TaxID=1563681 RepID=A0A1E5T0T5_9BACT|nr:tRNA pseudouridine(55) synthase TruB [Roseivirga misakiensis]OEK04992.1 tRNA pseudouridine(55) synthase TruB [Roseivirga misakiensis]